MKHTLCDEQFKVEGVKLRNRDTGAIQLHVVETSIVAGNENNESNSQCLARAGFYTQKRDLEFQMQLTTTMNGSPWFS